MALEKNSAAIPQTLEWMLSSALGVIEQQEVQGIIIAWFLRVCRTWNNIDWVYSKCGLDTDSERTCLAVMVGGWRLSSRVIRTQSGGDESSYWHFHLQFSAHRKYKPTKHDENCWSDQSGYIIGANEICLVCSQIPFYFSQTLFKFFWFLF